MSLASRFLIAITFYRPAGDGLQKQSTRYQAPLEQETAAEASPVSQRNTKTGCPQWPRVTFSVESKFCISFSNQGTKVWRLSEEQNHPSCVKQSQILPVYDGVGGHVFVWS